MSDQVSTTAILGKLATLEGAVPLAQANTENVILQQTNSLTGAIGSLALGTQQAFSNVKDAVQGGTLANSIAFCGVNSNIATSEARLAAQMAAGFNETQSLINRINTENISRELVTAQNKIIELEGDRRADRHASDARIHVEQTVNQAQAQAQTQAQAQQINDLATTLRFALSEIQSVRQAASNVNFGVQGANTQSNAASNNRVGN